jgi:hypothetical protein
MKTLYLLFLVLATGLALQAQTPNDSPNAQDTAMRHRMYHQWRHSHGMQVQDSLNHRYSHYGERNRWRGQDGYGYKEGYARIHHHSRDRRGNHGRFHESERYPFTPEQKKQAMAIQSDYHLRSADLLKNDNMTIREYKSRLLALNKEKKAKLEALLSPDQKQAMAKRKAQIDENRQVSAAAHLERLKIRLKLNDQQVAALKAQQTQLRAQMQAIRQNDQLLPSEKMDQIKGLASKRKDALKTILTPEQFSEMEGMHRHRFDRS